MIINVKYKEPPPPRYQHWQCLYFSYYHYLNPLALAIRSEYTEIIYREATITTTIQTL